MAAVLAACQDSPRYRPSTIFGQADTATDTIQVYDLEQIQQAGTLIGITLSGPDTYYEYRGQGFGPQYLLAEEFARQIGVKLQMEIAPDTAALLQKISCGEADFIALEMNDGRWVTREDTPQLTAAIDEWWDEGRKQRILKAAATPTRSVRRKMRPLMRDRVHGIISPYDDLFIQAASAAKLDWRLLAAQCSQESAFDCKAVSWAGARGLMQIMPQTANLLGVQSSELFHPETNIMTAVKYISQLEKKFSDVRHPVERRKFVLAAYNGGYNHIRDAMNLARHDKRNPYSWNVVSYYVLHLSEPRFYRHPVVKNGYMIGQETFNYVNRILQKWNAYVTGRHTPSPLPQADDLINVIPHKAHKKNRFSGEGNAILSRSDSLFN